MMAEYIDRELARDAILGEYPDLRYPAWYASKIDSIPAADVAPVVRCKDCKHCYECIEGLVCAYGPCVDCDVSKDFYCANGARRQAENEK